MRLLAIACILFLTGCQGIVGPLQYRKPIQVDDPRLPISEQQRLGRDRLAFPQVGYEAGPSSGLAWPRADGTGAHR